MATYVWHSRIRFVDTDASGRIHYSALFRHFEVAEEEFPRSLGFAYSGMQESGVVSYPRVKVEAEYLAALVYDDPVAIEVRVERVGRSSYTLAFSVKKDGSEAARGRITVVCMDVESGRARELPGVFAGALRERCGG